MFEFISWFKITRQLPRERAETESSLMDIYIQLFLGSIFYWGMKASFYCRTQLSVGGYESDKIDQAFLDSGPALVRVSRLAAGPGCRPLIGRADS